MKASNRNERNGPPLSVTTVTTGQQLAGLHTHLTLVDKGVAEHRLVVGQGELDRVVLVAGRETWNGCSYLDQ